MEQVRVQVLFTEQTKHGEFTDALYFTPAEYAAMNKASIDQLKQERVDKHVEAIDKAPLRPGPTKAEIQAELDSLDAEKVQLQSALLNANAALTVDVAVDAGGKI